MNRAELIDYIAQETGLSKADAERTLNATIDGITMGLGKGDPIAIAKLGTFVVRHRAARKGRNPQTGAEISIKAAKVVGFKPAKALKDVVNT